eukprot:4765338-Pyramimonas_sp.AAC.1
MIQSVAESPTFSSKSFVPYRMARVLREHSRAPLHGAWLASQPEAAHAQVELGPMAALGPPREQHAE